VGRVRRRRTRFIVRSFKSGNAVPVQMTRDGINGDQVGVLGTARGPIARCPLNFLGSQFASAQAPEHSVFFPFMHRILLLAIIGSPCGPFLSISILHQIRGIRI
jgi:hypothetical protein